MEIKIKINRPRGTAHGGLNWIKNQIENADVYVSKTKMGRICIAAKFPYFKEQPTGKVIAMYSNGHHDDMYWRERQDVGEGSIYVIHTSKPDYAVEPGLFDFPLTVAADKALDEFIEQCAAKLEEYILAQ